MKNFPKCSIPHEQPIHKNIHEPSIYLAQPVGKRCYAWFTYENERPVCYTVSNHSTLVNINYDESLAKGTVVYGTIVSYQSKQCFVVDNLLWYEGNPITCNYSDKLILITEFLKKVQHYSTNWMFMFPEMSMFMKTFHTVYNIYCIKIIPLSGNKIFNYIEKTEVFTVFSTSKTDIYELHNDKGFHSIAYIDTYEHSVYMRSVFNIEHTLDSIEESEDESDPLVSVVMICKWNESFKKWVPTSVKK